ncbi:amidohydrolase family protein [Chloroflexota bacterium]
MIIDFHTHVFPPQIREKRSQYVAADPSFALLYSSPRARLATADELVASMDECGIDISVITNLGWTTHRLCAETNDYIMESVARYPERLVGFCAVQPNSPEAAVAELERCARGGIRGVGELRPDMQAFDFMAEEVAPVLAAIEEHKLILLTHASEPVGHDYPGKGAITPDMLYPFIVAHPEMNVVCAHWGGGLPFYGLMPEVKKAMRNVFFDTAASPFLYSPEVYSRVIQLVGADKILFGSDYPLLSPSRLLGEVDSLGLAGADRESILSGNARRLLGIGAG